MTAQHETSRKPIKPDHTPTMRKMISNLIRAIIVAYGISMIIILVLRIVPGERLLPIAFLNSFLHLAWLPVLILLPLCLIWRKWREALLLSPVLLAFIVSYGPLFLPQPALSIPEHSITLKVMSYNILQRPVGHDDVINVIQTADADIVALQEVNVGLAAVIEDSLQGMYPYMRIHPGGADGIGQTGGQAVLSRYPILEDDFWFYQSPNLGNQRVLLDIDRRDVVLYNAHPAHPGLAQNRYFDPRIRQEQINDILQRANSETQPVFLMGDFNMPDLSEAYQSVVEHYVDAWQSAGWGLGWTFAYNPNLYPPFLRLDYVFHDENFVVSSASVWSENGGSDHSPVRATLHLLPE
ncbi:MAG: endonuclease/exonuclease/phosphatase family protein [Aggregatilineales bacterium]